MNHGAVGIMLVIEMALSFLRRSFGALLLHAPVYIPILREEVLSTHFLAA